MTNLNRKFDPPELQDAPCLVERVKGHEFYGEIFPDNRKGPCSQCRVECWVRPYNAHRELVCIDCMPAVIKKRGMS